MQRFKSSAQRFLSIYAAVQNTFNAARSARCETKRSRRGKPRRRPVPHRPSSNRAATPAPNAGFASALAPDRVTIGWADRQKSVRERGYLATIGHTRLALIAETRSREAPSSARASIDTLKVWSPSLVHGIAHDAVSASRGNGRLGRCEKSGRSRPIARLDRDLELDSPGRRSPWP